MVSLFLAYYLLVEVTLGVLSYWVETAVVPVPSESLWRPDSLD